MPKKSARANFIASIDAMKPASVTLLDLANDLDYWINDVRQYSMPGTGSIGTQKLHRKAIDGLNSLAQVIRGYAEAGFRIDSGKEGS